MVANVFNKFLTLAENHQVIAAAMISIGFIAFNWGFENILHYFLFPKRPVVSAFVAIVFGLLLIWMTKHYILYTS